MDTFFPITQKIKKNNEIFSTQIDVEHDMQSVSHISTLLRICISLHMDGLWINERKNNNNKGNRKISMYTFHLHTFNPFIKMCFKGSLLWKNRHKTMY